MRSALAFLVGFISGMFCLLVLLWSHGSLRPVRAAAPAPAPAPSMTTYPPVAPPTLARPTVAPPPATASQTVAPAAGSPVAPRVVPAVPGEVPPLIIPVENADRSKILDTFADARGGGPHEATDIMAPRGTPVLAAADGPVAKLFNSRRGGITIYQFDPTRTWCYYYAHLDRYAEGIKEGALLRQGQVIGYVGSTGDASPTAPHLHFAIFRLGPEKHWWQGTPINPYPLLMHAARQ